MVILDEFEIDDDDTVEARTLDFSDGNFSSIKSQFLNIASYNINSVLASNRLEELTVLIKDASIDILFLSETKLDSNISEDRFKIPGFNLEYCHRTRNGGGTMFYIKENITYKRNTKLNIMALNIYVLIY